MYDNKNINNVNKKHFLNKGATNNRWLQYQSLIHENLYTTHSSHGKY